MIRFVKLSAGFLILLDGNLHGGGPSFDPRDQDQNTGNKQYLIQAKTHLHTSYSVLPDFAACSEKKSNCPKNNQYREAVARAMNKP